MKNAKITIQYDGTEYNGWQIQAAGRTIQGELTRVLSALNQAPVTVHGAGRTDSGVHAEGQVANFMLERDFDPFELLNAVNANLDRDIRVIDCEFVDESFHARRSAKLKTYSYQIWNGDVVSPFCYRYVYHYRTALDLEAMQRAAALLPGTHDFSAFTVADSEAEGHVRTLRQLAVERAGPIISITAAADGFLRYMVRAIAGTLIEVGRGRRAPENVKATLESRNRSEAGPTAPASGLTLIRVDY
ncbi:MAG TPA: tRNA pseudouridine(38-40) synthase TruA [Blastocatellia bacterium]|nr:tRNA pseudouridine(38-40) synthase TruA [Blastocatellia bacterium]